MTATLEIVPSSTDVKTGVTGRRKIADGLAELLADTYRLTFKTHVYHWNVEGPLFHSIHTLTEAQYAELFAAADVIAERIRALGFLTPRTFDKLSDDSALKDKKKMPNAVDMIKDLCADHEQMAQRLHGLIEIAEAGSDAVTADLATERSAFHEKAAWMLRASTAE